MALLTLVLELLLRGVGWSLLALVAAAAVHWAYVDLWLMRGSGIARASGGLPVVGHLPVFVRRFRDLHAWIDEELDAGREEGASSTSSAAAGNGGGGDDDDDDGKKGGRQRRRRAIYSYVPFSMPFVMLADPRCAEHMLKTRFANYPKGQRLHDRLGLLLGDGIFGIDGESWKAQRRFSAHVFKTGLLRDGAIPIFQAHVQRVADKLDAAAAAAAGGKAVGAFAGGPSMASLGEVEMQGIFFRFTLDSIGELAFGRNIDSQNSTSTFHQSFDYLQRICMERTVVPWWRRHPITEQNIVKRSLATINRFCHTVIGEKKAAKLDPNADVVSRFLDHARTGQDKKHGVDCNDEFVRDIIVNFMVAGRDTTAVTLTWATWFLSQNPEAEQRLVEELHAAGIKGDTFPTYAQVNDGLPYLRAVIDETLRMRPPVWSDPKEAVEADELPGGLRVPAGATVNWTQYGMSYDPDMWAGADVRTFSPERWLEGYATSDAGAASKSASRTGLVGETGDAASGTTLRAPLLDHPYQFIPFQAGPRVCLGQRLAIVETGFVLATLQSRYRFRLAPGAKPPTAQSSITLQADELNMVVEKR